VQRREQLEGKATTITNVRPITVEEVKRTFVFLVDNPLVDLVFANANAFGMSIVKRSGLKVQARATAYKSVPSAVAPD